MLIYLLKILVQIKLNFTTIYKCKTIKVINVNYKFYTFVKK